MKKKAAPPKELYYCTVEHYKGDRPHFWEPTEGAWVRYYHPAEGEKPKRVRQICPDHVPPTFHTVDSLFDGIAHFGTSLAGGHLTVLEGFTATKTEEKSAMVIPILKLEGDGITFEIRFHELGKDEKLTHYSTAASGHTSFTTSQGSRTFDRTGVEDSFYVNYSDTVEAVIAKLQAQIKKVAESRERISGMVPVPGMGWLVTPASRDEITAKLLAGKSHTFTPSGFGTGYRIYHRNSPRLRYDERAKPETEAFFKVSPLWLEAMDCD